MRKDVGAVGARLYYEDDTIQHAGVVIGFGGIAGILLCIYYYSVSATMGGIYSMKAFAASVLGGLVDIRFSALGGLCIGVIENLGIAISAATFRDVFAFGFLILVLLIRPQGFVSKKGVRV